MMYTGAVLEASRIYLYLRDLSVVLLFRHRFEAEQETFNHLAFG